MRSLESARDALDIVLLSASDPPEHQTIVLLGKPDGGGGVSVIIEGEVPSTELASTLGLLAGAAGPGSPIVAATITPEPPTLTEDELASWHDLDAAVAEHGGGAVRVVPRRCGHRDRGRRVVGCRAEVARQRKSRERIPPPTGIASSFSATTLITPSAFSTRPRISSAGAPWPHGDTAPNTPSSRSR